MQPFFFGGGVELGLAGGLAEKVGGGDRTRAEDRP